jgi:hypothetical protein
LSSVPEPVARMAALFSTYPKPWCLAGGWAADAWRESETRAHGDIDIVVFEEDLQAMYEHLSPGWDLVAHDATLKGVSTEPWAGEPVVMPVHFHCRPQSPGLRDLLPWITPPFKGLGDGNDVEVVVNELERGEWVFHPEPRVAVPFAEAVRLSPWGLPTLAPEFLVFYKATAYVGDPHIKPRPRDLTDSEALLPLLSDQAKAWLREALTRVPHHDWARAIV